MHAAVWPKLGVRAPGGTVVQAQVEVVTGGSPRVFNPAAAAYYDKNVRNVYRIVNNKDIVPSLPPAQSG